MPPTHTESENIPVNHFDTLAVDINQLYTRIPLKKISGDTPWLSNAFQRVYRQQWLPIKLRRYAWELWHRSTIDQTWFERFKEYWLRGLGGRPLWGIHDFYFLHGIYRIKFQNSQVPDAPQADIHLDAWQTPELLYQLLHAVYRESLAPTLSELSLAERFSLRPWRSMLEFGCGTAPITTSLFDFYPPRNDRKIFIADIKTAAFHYGAYKFRHQSSVLPILLDADNNFVLKLPQTVDVIFCITVLEHLQQPLTTIQTLWDYISPGGLLVFDYIKSEGRGLDTYQSLRERTKVFDFIEKHFSIVFGHLTVDKSLPLTVARKKA